MSELANPVDPATLAHDFRTIMGGKIDDRFIDDHLAQIASLTTTGVYPATGSVASLVLYVSCQCTITGGETFNGGYLNGDVYNYCESLDYLYANTTNFALTATPLYTAFYFKDKNNHTLASFQAGAVSTVAGGGVGGGSWS